MIIKISTLNDGFNHLEFEEPLKVFGLDKPFTGNVKIKLTIEKSHNRLILNSKMNSLGQLVCDRCTVDFSYLIETEYDMVYLFGIEPVDNGSIDVTYLPVDTERINIASDVKDYFLLAIPMKKLCKEDCKGICSGCGEDLNLSTCKCNKKEIDDRWLPLMELKKKINNN